MEKVNKGVTINGLGVMILFLAGILYGLSFIFSGISNSICIGVGIIGGCLFVLGLIVQINHSSRYGS